MLILIDQVCSLKVHHHDEYYLRHLLAVSVRIVLIVIKV